MLHNYLVNIRYAYSLMKQGLQVEKKSIGMMASRFMEF